MLCTRNLGMWTFPTTPMTYIHAPDSLLLEAFQEPHPSVLGTASAAWSHRGRATCLFAPPHDGLVP